MKIFAIETLNAFAVGADDVNTTQPCYMYTTQHGTFFIGNSEGDVCVIAHKTDLSPDGDLSNTKRYHPDDAPTWSKYSKIARVIGSANVVEVFGEHKRRVLRGWVGKEFIFSSLENGGRKAVVLLPSDKIRTLHPKDLGLNRCWRKGCPFDRKYKAVGSQSTYFTRISHITVL